MIKTLGISLIFLCTYLPVVAGDGDMFRREVSGELAVVDLDLGSAGTFDYGSADGPKASASIGWYRTRLLQLGLRVAILDLESDAGETIDGANWGAFLGLNWPTSGRVAPFANFGFSFPAGNLGRRYRAAWGAAAGLKVYPSSHYGFSIALEYQKNMGEDYVPDGNAKSLNAGFLYRF